MKYILIVASVVLALLGFRQESMLGTISQTASSDTLNTFRLNVNAALTELTNRVGTSTAETQGQIAYWGTTSANPPRLASVATSAPAISSGFSYTGTLGYFINGSSGTLKQVLNENHYLIATSTGGLLVGTTSVPIGVGYGQVLNTVKCFTNVGTVNVHIGYGTASTSMFNASTTIGTITFASNNTMTSGVKMIMDVGTPASSAGKLVCTFNSTL